MTTAFAFSSRAFGTSLSFADTRHWNPSPACWTSLTWSPLPLESASDGRGEKTISAIARKRNGWMERIDDMGPPKDFIRGAGPDERAGSRGETSASSAALEELDGLLVLLGCGAALERAEVLAAAGLGVLLQRVESVAAVLELANHLGLPFSAASTSRANTAR